MGRCSNLPNNGSTRYSVPWSFLLFTPSSCAPHTLPASPARAHFTSCSCASDYCSFSIVGHTTCWQWPLWKSRLSKPKEAGSKTWQCLSPLRMFCWQLDWFSSGRELVPWTSSIRQWHLLLENSFVLFLDIIAQILTSGLSYFLPTGSSPLIAMAILDIHLLSW